MPEQQAFTNAAYLSDPAERSRAQGWDTRHPESPRNGGLFIERTHGYGDDTALMRFDRLRDDNTGLEKHPSTQLASGWWLTEDMFMWLLTCVFGATGKASQNIETQMLLPPEWNTADCMVKAFPKKGVLLGGWFGRPRSVLTAPEGAKKVMQGGGATQTEAWMYQLYIPGLSRQPHNALNWLEFEGVYSTKPQPGGAMSRWPCIRPGKPHR